MVHVLIHLVSIVSCITIIILLPYATYLCIWGKDE